MISVGGQCLHKRPERPKCVMFELDSAALVADSRSRQSSGSSFQVAKSARRAMVIVSRLGR